MHGSVAFFLCMAWEGGVRSLHLNILAGLNKTGRCIAASYVYFLTHEKKDFLGDLKLFKLNFLLLCEIPFRLAARKQNMTDHRNNFPWALIA